MRLILLVVIGVNCCIQLNAQVDSSAIAAEWDEAVAYVASGRYAEAHPLLDHEQPSGIDQYTQVWSTIAILLFGNNVFE